MSSQDEQWLLTEKYDGEKTKEFFTDCKQLALGEPLAYLIGHTPFLGCAIHLDGRPLIPRVETEFWVEQAIKTIRELQEKQLGLFSAEPHPPTPEPGPRSEYIRCGSPLQEDMTQPEVTILDLCAGSGCIGVAVAKHIKEARVDFAEIDARLLPTINKNMTENLDTPERCTTYHSNLFEAIPSDTKYHFILSNPPYVDPALNRTDASVQNFEPHVALYGGENGIEIIEQLISAAPNHLVSGGQLWIEHEPEQVGALAALAHQHGFSITHHPDQYDILRYSILVVQ